MLSCQFHATASLAPTGTSLRYPPGRKLEGPQVRSERWREEKTLDPAGSLTPAGHLVARLCTDWNTPAALNLNLRNVIN